MENTKHLLLTGMPGTGKITLIREVAEPLKDYHPAGFYTKEIRDHGVRRGFRLVTLMVANGFSLMLIIGAPFVWAVMVWTFRGLNAS